jgi:hypothetical protein
MFSPILSNVLRKQFRVGTAVASLFAIFAVVMGYVGLGGSSITNNAVPQHPLAHPLSSAHLISSRDSAAVAPALALAKSEQFTEIETELVTITVQGFDPIAITRPQGRFFLEVDNRTGLPQVDLRLDSEHGVRVQHARVPREQLDWYEPLQLVPGHYVLTETDHPEWRCEITITAR